MAAAHGSQVLASLCRYAKANFEKALHTALERVSGLLYFTFAYNSPNNAKSIITSLCSSVGENIRVFRSEIPFSVRAAECSLSGESIFSHDRNGKVAAAYPLCCSR